MYHSTPSTPKTAGKAPAPSPHTAVQTEGTLSFHKVEDENAWGIVVVSDKKRDCSGELFPHSIFVVLNDEVNVLQVKVKKVFPALSDTLFGEEPDAMYPALCMLYNENTMET